MVEPPRPDAALLPPGTRLELRRNWYGREFVIWVKFANAPQLSQSRGIGNLFGFEFKLDTYVDWTATITGFRITADPELADFWDQVTAASIQIVPRFPRAMTALIQEARRFEEDTRTSPDGELVLRFLRFTELADFYLMQLACHEVVCETVKRLYDATIILAAWEKWWQDLLWYDKTLDPQLGARHLAAIAELRLEFAQPRQ